MPRKPRFFLPDVPIHVVQRGHGREPVLFEDDDYFAYLRWLQEGAKRYGVAIHAYVLKTNHIHILASPQVKAGITRMMQYVGRHYVPYINHTYGTSGSLWEGRYKASLINDDEYLLTCMRYIELNPVRAEMVRSPGQYRWSSCRCNGQGKEGKLITPHSIYKMLGTTPTACLDACKALFKSQLEKGMLETIRCAWQTGTPLGNDYFRQKIEAKLNCKVGQARRGRPVKPKGEGLD